MADTLPPLQFGTTQNMPTNAGQVTQLPAQYQTAIDASMMRRALAQALLARGMQQRTGQTIETGGGAPNRYIRPSITQNLSDLASTVLGGMQLKQSQSELTGAMQNYQQGLHKELATVADTTAAGSPSTGPDGGTPPNVAPGGSALVPQAKSDIDLGSADAKARWKAALLSPYPVVQQQAKDLYDRYVDLARQEGILKNEQAIAGFKEAATNATVESKVAAAKGSGGMDSGQLQPPPPLEGGKPPSSVVGVTDPGTGFTPNRNPSTGAVSLEAGLEPKLAQELQTKQLTALNDSYADMNKNWGNVRGQATMGAVADAFVNLVRSGKVNTGALATERAEVDQFAPLVGHAVAPGTTYTQIARELALKFLGAAKGDSGFATRMSTQEAGWLKDVNGSNLDLQSPALLAIGENYSNHARAEVEASNAKALYSAEVADSMGAHNLAHLHRLLVVNPESIAPVTTGLPPPGAAPVVPPPTPYKSIYEGRFGAPAQPATPPEARRRKYNWQTGQLE